MPKGYPEPGLFQQSVGWVDKDGNGLRYQIIYSNAYHGMGVYPSPPKRWRRPRSGAAVRAGGRGGGPAEEAGAGAGAPAP